MEVEAVRFAYADPPYLGQAKKHYGPEAREVNHPLLLSHLQEFEAWALSCSSPSLKDILVVCPDDVRVGAWVKPFGIFKPHVDPAYVWEPVVFKTARQWSRDQKTCRDWVSANITLKKGLVGVKPEPFWFWLFDLLGASPTDEFHDLFPGSGAGAKAWEAWKAGSQ